MGLSSAMLLKFKRPALSKHNKLLYKRTCSKVLRINVLISDTLDSGNQGCSFAEIQTAPNTIALTAAVADSDRGVSTDIIDPDR